MTRASKLKARRSAAAKKGWETRRQAQRQRALASLGLGNTIDRADPFEIRWLPYGATVAGSDAPVLVQDVAVTDFMRGIDPNPWTRFSTAVKRTWARVKAWWRRDPAVDRVKWSEKDGLWEIDRP